MVYYHTVHTVRYAWNSAVKYCKKCTQCTLYYVHYTHKVKLYIVGVVDDNKNSCERISLCPHTFTHCSHPDDARCAWTVQIVENESAFVNAMHVQASYIYKLHGGTEGDCLRALWSLPWCLTTVENYNFTKGALYQGENASGGVLAL